MANNRMYLLNRRTGTRIYIAKYYPSTGWLPVRGVENRMLNGFDLVDFGHLTSEQRRENFQHLGLGVPHPSAGGMYGAEWELEYETEGET